jgi:hypothetical protein
LLVLSLLVLKKKKPLLPLWLPLLLTLLPPLLPPLLPLLQKHLKSKQLYKYFIQILNRDGKQSRNRKVPFLLG